MSFTQELFLKIVPIVITSLLAYLVGKANKREAKKDKDKDCAIQEMSALKGGLCALLKVNLIEYHDKYLNKGEIPHYARENFDEMYKAYHALGGNGTGTIMYNEVCKLKSKSE